MNDYSDEVRNFLNIGILHELEVEFILQFGEARYNGREVKEAIAEVLEAYELA